MDASDILSLVRISVAVALRSEETLRRELKSALRRIPVPMLREALLQTYLFAGYASCINALVVLNELCPDDASFLTESEASLEVWQKRGEELCRKIYGAQFEKLTANMKALHPDLADWMIVEGYGKVLSRPFLSPAIRELLIVAMTAAIDAPRQYHSHLRGALHVGATREQLRQVFSEVESHLKPETASRLRAMLESLCA